MARSRIALQPAFVLRSTPYRDSSLLVEAFTAQHGRVGLVARGVRAPKSRLRVLLQVFQPLLLSWTEAAELGTLAAAEADGPALALGGEQVFSGWYLNELLLRLLHRDDPHPALFQAYAAALAALPQQGARALRLFELSLLAELGFGLDLPDELQAAQAYRYEPGSGLRAVGGAEPGTVSGRCLIALRDQTLHAPEDQREARDLLRSLLAEQLGNKPLATATVLRALRDGGR